MLSASSERLFPSSTNDDPAASQCKFFSDSGPDSRTTAGDGDYLVRQSVMFRVPAIKNQESKNQNGSWSLPDCGFAI